MNLARFLSSYLSFYPQQAATPHKRLMFSCLNNSDQSSDKTRKRVKHVSDHLNVYAFLLWVSADKPQQLHCFTSSYTFDEKCNWFEIYFYDTLRCQRRFAVTKAGQNDDC